MSEKNTVAEEEPTADQTAIQPAPRRKRILVGAGATSIAVATGWALSLVAAPHEVAPAAAAAPVRDPALVNVSPPTGFQVNLSGFGGKHYLAMHVMAEIVSFDSGRSTALDPLTSARLQDAVLRVSSRKNKAELSNPAGKETFREELRAALDAVIFPVHVGNEKSPDQGDPKSGLAPGASAALSTLRGSYSEHAFTLDVARKQIRLDDGQVVEFGGDESDLEVRNAAGESVFLDVSALNPRFLGDVPVGVFGSVRDLYFTGFLVQ